MRALRQTTLLLVGLGLVLLSSVPGRSSPGQSTEPQALPELPPRQWTETHIDGRLLQLADTLRQDGLERAAELAELGQVPLTDDGDVRVTIRLNAAATYRGSSAASLDQIAAEEALFGSMERSLVERVAALGGRVRGRTRNLVEARVPLSAVRSLEDAPEVGWVMPVAAPVPMQSGQVVSQGVRVSNADVLQDSTASYGAPTGKIKVGILDLGFLLQEELRGTELPIDTVTHSFHKGGITAAGAPVGDRLHGTGVAEIVHDMAPNAQLFLTNIDTSLSHSLAVDWLISQDVDVISNSLGWFNLGPGDGRGPINDDVRRALDAGIEWVVSAGNHAQLHWEGQFTDLEPDGFHNFAGIDQLNSVFLEAGEVLRVFLNWDDWFLSDQDYDLYVFGPEGLSVTCGSFGVGSACSLNPQTGVQPPTEDLAVLANRTGLYHVFITRFSATRAVKLEMFTNRNMEHTFAPGSVTIPADTPGAIAVGATNWQTDILEPFSSQGPTSDGRLKPEISAPDAVDTFAFGIGLASLASVPTIPFSGTSAAAPHVSGAIALMKSRFGVFTLDQIEQILQDRAVDKGMLGKDNQYGAGRLDVKGR